MDTIYPFTFQKQKQLFDKNKHRKMQQQRQSQVRDCAQAIATLKEVHEQLFVSFILFTMKNIVKYVIIIKWLVFSWVCTVISWL